MTGSLPPASSAKNEDGLTSLRPEWLLRHALRLAAEWTADTTVPRSVHARRSVSASYYALFHRVCITTAWTVLTEGEDEDKYKLCRLFRHGDVDVVCNWMLGAQTLPKSLLGAKGLVTSAAASIDMQTFAEAFVHLKREREKADYDHLVVFGRSGAMSMNWVARAAIDAVDRSRSTEEPAWWAFTSLLLLRTGAKGQ